MFSEVDDMGNYARCYYIAKDYENAIKWFAKAESTGSGLTDGDHLCIYGTCLIDYYQDYTNAIGYYESKEFQKSHADKKFEFRRSFGNRIQ